MKLRLICIGVCIGVIGSLCIGLVLAQTKIPNLDLRGDRFKPLTYDQLTPQQKTLVEHILAGPRTTLDGPFNILLRDPEMGDLVQQLGAYVRFHSAIPRRLNEFAILIVARAWSTPEEWHAHHRDGVANGLNPALVAAVAVGKRPPSMQPDEEVVYNFTSELVRTKQVSDATFAAAKEKFGERGVVDLLGVIGYYELVAGMLDVDRYPLAPGVKPELKPLK